MLDNVVVAQARPHGTAPIGLGRRDDLTDHPRVGRAARYRTDLRVYTDETGAGVLVIGRGLAGRWEMAFEARPEGARPRSGPGVGGAGYVPIGSECLFPRRG